MLSMYFISEYGLEILLKVAHRLKEKPTVTTLFSNTIQTFRILHTVTNLVLAWKKNSNKPTKAMTIHS